MIALNPFEIEEQRQKHGGLAVMAILTTQTCGEPCWHAREDVCRCSCGGRNHGCLNNGGERPERSSRINGHMYRLKAVGRYADIVSDAVEINRLAGYKSVDKPCLVIDGSSKIWSRDEIESAKAAGQEMWWSQYRYTWSVTDHGAPARLKPATDSQRKWNELSGWKEERDVYLLWQLVTMPPRCQILVVDKTTGEPLTDQIPEYCHA